jgi:flagellin-like protein
MKRGVSPIIAVVLLVGLAVSLAVVLLNFFDVFSQDRIDEIDVESLKNDLCTDKTWLGLNGYCVNTGPARSDLHISFENDGAYPIEEIFFKVTRVDDPSISITYVHNLHTPGYGIGSFIISDANTFAGDYNVIVEKKLDSNGTAVNCDPIENEMELFSCRT